MLPLDTISAIRATLPTAEMPEAASILRDAASLQRSDEITPLAGTASVKPVQPLESFSTMLDNLVTEVNARQTHARDVVRELQSGGNVPIHQATIAMEEAHLSFQLMVEVRNKVLEAYNEVMRMQV